MTKTLKRFLIPTSLEGPLVTQLGQQKPTVLLSEKETHHLRNVLRMKEGALCVLVDQEGHEYVSRVIQFRTNGSVELELVERTAVNGESALLISVAQAIPQHRKMDSIVQKAAELGVFELIPLVTERTVVRMTEDRRGKVGARWNRIAAQTVKQCRLNRAPYISKLRTFSSLFSQVEHFDAVFLLHPGKDSMRAQDLFRREQTNLKQLGGRKWLLVIGPEGGFSRSEVGEAISKGAKVVRLGDGILKTDTAFILAAGLFQMMGA